MKIGIQAWGTYGDIRPLCAFAISLREAGYEPTLVYTYIANKEPEAHKEYQEFGRKFDFAVRMTPYEAEDSAELLRQFMYSRDLGGQARAIFEKCYLPELEKTYEAATTLCRENEVVFANQINYPLSIAAEKANIPCSIVSFCHGYHPTRYAAPNNMPTPGKFFNALLWKAAERSFDRYTREPINALRVREGLRPIRSSFREGLVSQWLNLIAVSPTIARRYPDWGEHYHICGFFDISDSTETWQMPDDLKTFLEEGAAPVYITFGSMLQLDPSITETLVKAVEIAGCRAIIQSQWEKFTHLQPSPKIYRIGTAVHRKIFPYCSLVVHHGGSGTSQTAARCGCPSIVVEHFGDQLFFGLELKRLGIGKLMHRRSLAPKKLARTIRLSLDNAKMKNRATEIGNRMSTENGTKQAIQIMAKKLRKPIY